MQDADAPPRKKWKVVIADDNRDAADALAILMELDGHEVTVLPDGATALRAIEKGRPDVVVLDIGMPELDGYEVARRVRERRSTSVALIAVTGWGKDEDKARAFIAGFDHHLLKPVDPDELSSLLQSITVT